MGQTLYRTTDHVLARKRHDRAVPEVFHRSSKKWAPYPQLDTLHDAREISVHEAAQLEPDANLNVDARAPLLPPGSP